MIEWKIRRERAVLGPTTRVHVRGPIQVRCVVQVIGPESAIETPGRRDRKHTVLGL